MNFIFVNISPFIYYWIIVPGVFNLSWTYLFFSNNIRFTTSSSKNKLKIIEGTRWIHCVYNIFIYTSIIAWIKNYIYIWYITIIFPFSFTIIIRVRMIINHIIVFLVFIIIILPIWIFVGVIKLWKWARQILTIVELYFYLLAIHIQGLSG
jgi:hypothetical protein